jgi:hypothetical protein
MEIFFSGIWVTVAYRSSFLKLSIVSVINKVEHLNDSEVREENESEGRYRFWEIENDR